MPALLAAAGVARAAPEDARAELRLEAGSCAGESAVALGAAGVARAGPLVGEASIAGGARVPVLVSPESDVRQFGFATLLVGVDAGADRDPGPDTRSGAAVLVDLLAVDSAEQGCGGIGGCRFGLFVGGRGAAGVALQPAAGFRIASGSGGPTRDGVGWSFLVAAQPHVIHDLAFPLAPRLDVAIWDRRHGWSLHAWAGRFGGAAGIGRPLGRRRADPP